MKFFLETADKFTAFNNRFYKPLLLCGRCIFVLLFLFYFKFVPSSNSPSERMIRTSILRSTRVVTSSSSRGLATIPADLVDLQTKLKEVSDMYDMA